MRLLYCYSDYIWDLICAFYIFFIKSINKLPYGSSTLNGNTSLKLDCGMKLWLITTAFFLFQVLRQVTHGMQDLKQSMCTSRADSAKPPIPEPHLNSIKSDEQHSKHFFTKLRPTGLKLTNEPSETQCPLDMSTTKQDYDYNAAFPIQPGFNSNCSHPTPANQPTNVHQQFQAASKGNSHSGNSDSQWLSSKSPSQSSPLYASKQASQYSSSNATNPPSQLNQSYPNSMPSRFNTSASNTQPSQLSLSSQANNRLSKFNASYPTTNLASLTPSEFGSSSPVIPLSNSSPACLASQTSQMNPSCHSKMSFASKASQMVQSSQGSINPLPPSDSPRTARATRSEPKNKPDKAPHCILNGKKWIVVSNYA